MRGLERRIEGLEAELKERATAPFRRLVTALVETAAALLDAEEIDPKSEEALAAFWEAWEQLSMEDQQTLAAYYEIREGSEQ